MTNEETRFLERAIELSSTGMQNLKGGPFGCVIVKNGEIVGEGSNEVTASNDPTAHAEIIALTSAFNYLGAKYLPDATLFVTVEPCLMCTGAMYWSKLGRIVWGADDEKNGHARITGANWPFHPKTIVEKGILADECAALMKAFFRERR